LNSTRLYLGVVLCLTLSACGKQGEAVPSDRFHRLVLGMPATIYQNPHLAGTLEVDRFRATGVLQDRAVVFVEHANPNVLHQYYYHLWADSPTRMLQTATIDFLREAHVADQVAGSDLRIVPTYTLMGDIKKLDHVVGNSSSVDVEIEFALRDHAVDNVVWVKTYTASRAVKDGGVSAATREIGVAVQEILNQVSTDLARR
jgi:ABC-type uncharacterized transport system auxiliary subunit